MSALGDAAYHLSQTSGRKDKKEARRRSRGGGGNPGNFFGVLDDGSISSAGSARSARSARSRRSAASATASASASNVAGTKNAGTGAGARPGGRRLGPLREAAEMDSSAFSPIPRMIVTTPARADILAGTRPRNLLPATAAGIAGAGAPSPPAGTRAPAPARASAPDPADDDATATPADLIDLFGDEGTAGDLTLGELTATSAGAGASGSGTKRRRRRKRRSNRKGNGGAAAAAAAAAAEKEEAAAALEVRAPGALLRLAGLGGRGGQPSPTSSPPGIVASSTYDESPTSQATEEGDAGHGYFFGRSQEEEDGGMSLLSPGASSAAASAAASSSAPSSSGPGAADYAALAVCLLLLAASLGRWDGDLLADRATGWLRPPLAGEGARVQPSSSMAGPLASLKAQIYADVRREASARRGLQRPRHPSSILPSALGPGAASPNAGIATGLAGPAEGLPQVYPFPESGSVRSVVATVLHGRYPGSRAAAGGAGASSSRRPRSTASAGYSPNAAAATGSAPPVRVYPLPASGAVRSIDVQHGPSGRTQARVEARDAGALSPNAAAAAAAGANVSAAPLELRVYPLPASGAVRSIDVQHGPSGRTQARVEARDAGALSPNAAAAVRGGSAPPLQVYPLPASGSVQSVDVRQGYSPNASAAMGASSTAQVYPFPFSGSVQSIDVQIMPSVRTQGRVNAHNADAISPNAAAAMGGRVAPLDLQVYPFPTSGSVHSIEVRTFLEPPQAGCQSPPVTLSTARKVSAAASPNAQAAMNTGQAMLQSTAPGIVDPPLLHVATYPFPSTGTVSKIGRASRVPRHIPRRPPPRTLSSPAFRSLSSSNVTVPGLEESIATRTAELLEDARNRASSMSQKVSASVIAMERTREVLLQASRASCERAGDAFCAIPCSLDTDNHSCLQVLE